MRTKKRANFARLSGTQFAVVTLFRKGLDLRTRPFLSSRGLPIATSMDDERQGSLKQGLARLYATSTFPIMHLICPPKFGITLVFHFSWVLQLSQEIENSAYARVWGAKKVHYGKCGSGVCGNSFYCLKT